MTTNCGGHKTHANHQVTAMQYLLNSVQTLDSERNILIVHEEAFGSAGQPDSCNSAVPCLCYSFTKIRASYLFLSSDHLAFKARGTVMSPCQLLTEIVEIYRNPMESISSLKISKDCMAKNCT